MASLQFHAEDVSAAASGDYYQLSLGPVETDGGDPFESAGPYLLVQREFEFPAGPECYIESDNEDYIGHFPLKLVELSQTKLEFDILRHKNNRVAISFTLQATEFDEGRRIAEIIFGLREPQEEDNEPWLPSPDRP
jgi:hypothetical protein